MKDSYENEERRWLVFHLASIDEKLGRIHRALVDLQAELGRKD